MKEILNRHILIALGLIVLSGCSIINPYGTLGEKGKIWCNERYRKQINWGESEKKAAVNGYMYSLAAALTLQSDDINDKEARAHYFKRPERLKIFDQPKRTPSGFEVITFKLKPLDEDGQEEFIIAFAGSNDRSDWLSTNLNPFGRNQYTEAVNYTKNILGRDDVKGRKVVLAGISLGGGLVIHVLKHQELEPLIDEAWAINPSPKIYSSTAATERMKKKTWLVYSGGEILSWARGWLQPFIVGAGPIEAGVGQTAEFNLIKSNRIYAHFRWGITRQMLWVADYEISRHDKSLLTEPLAILKESEFRACSASNHNTQPDQENRR